MVIELAFEPSGERLAARPAHRERLAELHAQGRLLMAGPWEDDSGALLVFEAERPELDDIMAADPYYTMAGVTVLAVRDWRPVVGSG